MRETRRLPSGPADGTDRRTGHPAGLGGPGGGTGQPRSQGPGQQAGQEAGGAAEGPGAVTTVR
ncbi:hypothetical protein Ate02nite_86810 [Paractinoplanes tereljensis]|uniref:Uncharacterized protein n=1 Tax=Paractinoplanes tereljensis TaxID=571912 RepID=A0A919NVC4_9ACTN|nr:hypothetical protein Ate02nite_86810 [Actinoplanes tereljensis]